MGAKIDELISSVGVGDDGVSMAYPDTFLADISNAAIADSGSADAMILTLQTEKAALEAELIAVKAHNYELIQQIPRPETESADEPSDDDSPEDSDDDDIFENESE